MAAQILYTAVDGGLSITMAHYFPMYLPHLRTSSGKDTGVDSLLRTDGRCHEVRAASSCKEVGDVAAIRHEHTWMLLPLCWHASPGLTMNISSAEVN